MLEVDTRDNNLWLNAPLPSTSRRCLGCEATKGAGAAQVNAVTRFTVFPQGNEQELSAALEHVMTAVGLKNNLKTKLQA